MNQWLFWLLFAPIFGFAMYQMYCQGIAVSKSVTAVMFIFHPGKDADKARVGSCTGYVRHAGRFRENRSYEFVLDAQLTQGEVEVLLLDQQKRQVLRLNRWHPVDSAALDGSSRYFLHWNFTSATGECELRW